jgi:hypothetical protein
MTLRAAEPMYLALKPLTPRAITLSRIERTTFLRLVICTSDSNIS